MTPVLWIFPVPAVSSALVLGPQRLALELLPCASPFLFSFKLFISLCLKFGFAVALLPGKSHGQRSLVGYSPWSREELDVSEHTHEDPHKRQNHDSFCVLTVVVIRISR